MMLGSGHLPIVLILFNSFCNSVAFFAPDIELEAFAPTGFRISTPDVPGVVYFEVSGKINNAKFAKKILQPENGIWTYFDPEICLKIGDVVQYSVTIKSGKVLYNDDNLSWTVTALKCASSPTIVNGKAQCKGTVIFEDDFRKLDKSKWTVQHYIPNSGPSYEFNTYENSRDTVNVVRKNLKIKPILRKRKSDLHGEIDFSKKCTSQVSEDCYQRGDSTNVLPPIRSGKIRSKFSFVYGRIDVKAKLPTGDWIFPDISLVPVDGSDLRLAVAYSRGNVKFSGNDGVDTGGTLLFGGLMISPTEPNRSLLLRSIRNNETYSSTMHTYSLIWKPGVITTLIDNVEYGRVSNSNTDQNMNRGPFNTEFSVSLGVGVGGITDFPDNYTYGDHVKPWQDRDVDRMRKFYEARNVWLPTWKGDQDLEIDYVRVTAI